MLYDVTGKTIAERLPASQRERQRHEMIAVINAQGIALDSAIRDSRAALALARDFETRLAALERAHVYAMTRTRWQRIWALVRR